MSDTAHSRLGAEYRRLTFAAAELHAEVPEHLLPGVILLCHWPRL